MAIVVAGDTNRNEARFVTGRSIHQRQKEDYPWLSKT